MLDAVKTTRETAVSAENARLAATEAARQAARELKPVSVLISRQTQRLYVRQAFEPVFDAPITISDADRPLGSYVFTATARESNADDIRWSVVSLAGSHGHDRQFSHWSAMGRVGGIYWRATGQFYDALR